MWPSILVPGNVEIPLERERERTEKPQKLFGEIRTLIGLGDSWDVGGGSWREERGRCKR